MESSGLAAPASPPVFPESALLFEFSLSEAALMRSYPVAFRAPNKSLVAHKAYPKGTTAFLDTVVRVTRWDAQQASLPSGGPVGPCPEVEIVGHFFEYTAADGMSAWYPNFAHERLFTAWDSKLLAQDELQALEFPVLCSLPRALPAEHCRTAIGKQPTPVLIQHAPRRVAIDTASQPSIY